jgi:hypothetical protein
LFAQVALSDEVALGDEWCAQQKEQEAKA